MYALETDRLTKKYNSQTVVNNVSLKVKKGDIFGFLGKNGAGKSTFINMVTSIITPSSGEFNILGYSEVNNIKNKIGVLPDYSTFYDDLNGIEHLNFFSKLLGVNNSKSDLMKLLELVELQDAAYVKAKKYSFGMKKKLGIAQALVNNPDLIFLDEPTSGVDANAVLSIHSLIRKIANKGKTIFLTSHNLDEVEKLCDEIAIMNKGVIEVQGSLQQLRQQFQTHIKVIIKHSVISIKEEESLSLILNSLSDDVEQTAENITTIIVKNESIIPKVNNAFLDQKIDIYRVEVEELSLEKIFLNIDSFKKTL